MKKIIYRNIGVYFALFFLSQSLFSQENKLSFSPGELWPDNNGVHINAHGGGILYQDGVYYLYGEHKIEGSAGNNAHVGVHCYSSKDLYRWKDEGIALAVAPEGSGSDIEKGCILERPKVIYNKNTGKYVMWFHLEPKGAEGYSGARSGIAVADKPAGPFAFVRSLRPNAGYFPMNYPDKLKNMPDNTKGQKFSGGSLPAHPDSLNIIKRDFEGGQDARDMTLFVDDDGKAYHIYASEGNSTLHISLLSDDYQSQSGTYARFFAGRFMEAPAIFKKDGKYYLIMSGCTGWAPNAGRSAVAPSIWGPWQELGNPFVGADSTTSFRSQSTYVLPVQGRKAQFIYMGDRWMPENAIDGRYIWLPIRFDGEQPIIEWKDNWQLNTQNIASSDTVFVRDFGLQPDSRENAIPYVQKALEACKGKINPVLVFPKGRYDFWPQHCVERVYFESNTQDINPKRLAILIEKIDGLTIDGNASEFVFHDRMQPFTIDNSQNIIIKNLSIDWDIPLIAQSEIAAVTDNYIDLNINPESPYIIEKDKLVFTGEGWKSQWWGTMEFEKDTRIVSPRSGDGSLGKDWGNYRAEELATGRVRLHYSFKRKPKTGNWLILRHSRRDHAGIFITNSKNVSVENMNMYHYCGLGILSQYSENLTFTGVNCVPNEQKGRILAGFADGFQYSNCKGNVIVKNCVFHALMDDPINVHGTSVRVIKQMDAHTLRCKFMHPESVGMTWAYPGDSVGFIDSKIMQTCATGIVKSFRKIDDELFEVTFVKPIPKFISSENALENLTWTCDVSITNSQFKSCRARGLLLSTPGKVVVEKNMFESSGAAILIAGDANYWYESGAVKDVRIAKNIFTAPCLTSMYGGCDAVISIHPEIPQKSDNAPAFHRNIVITENEFYPFDYPVLYALSVDNIEFSNNKLIRSRDFEPFHNRKHGLTFEYCKNVTVKGNIQEGGILGNTVALLHTPVKQLHLDKKSLFKISK